jgi:hypothetical protein
MPISCPNCGSVNRNSARYCQVCAQPLAAVLPANPPGQAAASAAALAASVAGSANPARLTADSGLTNYLQPPLVKIGRAPDNDLILTHNQTSAYHAQIHIQGDQHTLSDSGSTNGTYLNGQKLSSPAVLKSGDRVAFGPEKFTFQSGGAGTVLMTAPPPTASQAHAWPSLSGSKPAISPAAHSGAHAGASDFWGPKLVGYVTNANPPQQEQPPTDPARVLTMLAVSLGFFGVLLNFAIAAFAIGIILLICGGAALLFILPFLLMPLQMAYSGLMNWLKDDKPVMTLRFAVEDETTRQPVDVLLLLRPGAAGNILLGDRVMIWGQRHGGALRAAKVTVVERNGQGTNIPIPAKKPWPLWIGLVIFAGVIIGLLYLAQSLGLVNF